ncbi:MAG: ATP synthase F1 subunit epsilon [Bacteroidales bacterium]|nr:MAG: ATP synthase F1 subunit epsilon [Bacteroidales bacterium]
MLLEIVTPKATIYKGNIALVRVPGSKGSFAVMHNHAALTSTLEPGVIKVVEVDKTELYFDITEVGIIEVKKNHVVVLSDSIKKSE